MPYSGCSEKKKIKMCFEQRMNNHTTVSTIVLGSTRTCQIQQGDVICKGKSWGKKN